VHRAAWPTVDEVPGDGDATALGAVGAALAVIRKAKSEAKVGMRAEVPSMTLVGPDAVLAHVRSAEADLRAAGKLTGPLDYAQGDEVGARDIELVAVAKPTA
jgi:valyl-tRNA synthetase